jgi:tripartite-type tricarboxylate transporter receptor subunit TctC
VKWTLRLGGTLAGLGLLVLASGASAQSAEDFYKGRQLSVYIGYGAGGGYDLYSRLLAKHIGRQLPGNPNVIPRNEPGAGSFKLANELYHILPKDGSVVGMFSEALIISQILGDPAAKFVPSDFNWIGRLADSDAALVTTPNAPVKSFKDALNTEVVIGVPGAGSATLLNVTVVKNLFSTKFKFVSGYEGSAQLRLAMERNEVQGSGSILWRVDRDWIRAGGYNVIYQASLEPAPDLTDVPTLVSLARNDNERKVLRFFSSYTTIGRSIVAPPQVPADRVKVLRAAFDATVKDPAFLADAAKGRMDIVPLSGDKLEALIREVSGLDATTLAWAKQLSGSKAGD